MLTFERAAEGEPRPSTVETDRDGRLYRILLDGAYIGWTARIGFYSGTWSGWTPLGTFVVEADTRAEAAREVAEYLRKHAGW